MKIGIDLGSTYSTVSRYIDSRDSAETVTLREGDPASIPSVVAMSRRMGSVMCGNGAKNKIGNSAYSVYEAFKMLLVENDAKMIAKKGYSKEFTPRDAAKCFLEYLLTGAMKRYAADDEELEEVVICVPEVWCKGLKTLDGRNILREIMKNDVELPNHKKIPPVKIVTEPEAASAFFAHNYEIETKKKFNGHLLLIDYGGGTLDVTLTQVISDGEKSMEIGYRDSGGAGENHADENGNYMIGNAGIAYMQRVVEYALIDSGVIESSEEVDSGVNETVRDLEDALKDSGNIDNIEYEFGKLGEFADFEEIMEEETKLFCPVCYNDEEVVVTYQHLYRAYMDVIADVLQNELERINKTVTKFIGADPCKIESGLRDDFKIALVGGFGSFYLVRKQVESIYHLDPYALNDLRVKNINAAQSEQAIALGAALIASGRVVLQKTARYSIGLFSNNKTILSYGIKFHQRIEPEKPYFLLHGNAEEDTVSNRFCYASLRNNITHFAIGHHPYMNKGFPAALKPEFLERLAAVPDGQLWHIAFSMDENDIISFHIVPMYPTDGNSEGIVIPLDSYTNMFDLTAGEEVCV